MFNEIAVVRDDVAPIVAATFPDYRGKRFRVRMATSVTLSDLNWSGGTRSQYRGATTAGEATGGADRYNAMAPWVNPAEGKSIDIPPGMVVVQHTMFCGKDHGLVIHMNPADGPKYLAPPVTITDHERTVLDATASLKSSYMGKDRYQMRRDDAKYSGKPFMSRAEWDAAKAALIERKLLNAAGAITNAGRNAINTAT